MVTSTWFTLGKTLAYARIARSFFADQLETPIDLALPAACSASIAAHVSLMLGLSCAPVQLVTTGQ